MILFTPTGITNVPNKLADLFWWYARYLDERGVDFDPDRTLHVVRELAKGRLVVARPTNEGLLVVFR